MAKIECGGVSFEIKPDNDGEMRINFTSQSMLTFGIQIFRMNASGPTQVFATGQVQIDGANASEVAGVGQWQDDVYIVQIYPGWHAGQSEVWEAAFKLVNGESRTANPVEVGAAVEAQHTFRNAEYLGDHHLDQAACKMHVLLDKCLLDYEQVFFGGVLKPLNIRLGPQSVIAAINALLPKGIVFNQTARLDAEYGREHPLCLVTFQNVRAGSLSDSVKAIYPTVKRIIAALGQDRGAAPEILAYLRERSPTDFELVTPSQIYRGNLVHGFGPGVTPRLNIISEAGARQPWLDFLLNLMASVRQQTSEEAMLFLAWSLIESAAKSRIPRGEEPILDERGVSVRASGRVLTTAKDLGRVMIYLRDHVGAGILGLHAGNGRDFYSEVKLAYQCRNAIAHEGGIFRPGSAPPEGYYSSFPFSIRDWASAVVDHECALPADADP
ncbi:hypothetical protein ACN9JG_06815 [Cereibacter azotoformans]|uniref:hypothetical protein n=1 Tax=Cereibacter azotoformans TaxID=43057 RepID=UPI003B20BCC3